MESGSLLRGNLTRSRATLRRLAQIAARIAQAPVCYIERVSTEHSELVGRYGIDFHGYPAEHCRWIWGATGPRIFEIKDVGKDRRLAKHPILREFPETRSLIVSTFDLSSPFQFGAIVLLDSKPDAVKKTATRATLADLSIISKHKLNNLQAIEAVLAGYDQREAKQLESAIESIESSPDPIVIFDRAIRVVGANTALLSRVNRPLSSLVGKFPSELMKSAPSEMDEFARQVAEGKNAFVFKQIRTSTGRCYDLLGVPVPGSSLHFIGTIIRRHFSEDEITRPAAYPDMLSKTMFTGLAEAPPITEPTCDFLLDTLVSRQSVHHRNSVNYLSLRAWRKPLKQYQITALRSLKENPSEPFVGAIAREVAAASQRLFGRASVGSVVPVPCGSSGRPDCLSVRVAQSVSTILKVPFLNILEPQGKKGRSHPKNSARLAPYRVIGAANGPVLVVDDVASSGKHMELACSAIRDTGTAVTGIAWIGP